MKKFYASIILGILLLSAILSVSFTVNAQSDESWPMFHHDLAHTGYSNTNGPSTNQTLWTFPIINNGWVLTSPAVVNGVVYFTSSDKGFHLQTTNNNIYAVNAKDGSKSGTTLSQLKSTVLQRLQTAWSSSRRMTFQSTD